MTCLDWATKGASPMDYITGECGPNGGDVKKA